LNTTITFTGSLSSARLRQSRVGRASCGQRAL
jgi:hypothetical protein